jgi:hypothetical protein
MDETNVSPSAPASHPFAFESLDEASKALRDTIMEAREMEELGRLLEAAAGAAYLMAEAEHSQGLRRPEVRGQVYLLDKALALHEAILAWLHRVHGISIILDEENLDALRRYPGFARDLGLATDDDDFDL